MTSASVPIEQGSSTQANRWTLALFALMGLLFGLLAHTLRTPNYDAEARVSVGNPIGTIAEEVEVVTSGRVLDAAATIVGFRPNISVEANEVAKLLTITARTDDPGSAAAAANAVANTYIQSQNTAAAALATVAEPNDSPVGPGRVVFALVGSAVGAALGLLLGLFMGSRRPARSRSRVPAEAATVPTPKATPAGGFSESFAAELVEPASTESRIFSSTQLSEPAAVRAAPAVDANPSSVVIAVEPSAEHPAPVDAVAINATDGESLPTFLDASELWGDGAGSDTFAEPATDQPAVTPVHTAAGSGSFTAFAVDEPIASSAGASHDDAGLGPRTLTATAGDTPAQADIDLRERAELDRKALHSQFEAARYEQTLAHEQELAHRDAEHELQMGELQQEIAVLKKQARAATSQLKQQAGNDQHRVGDLQAQVDIAEEEARSLRAQLEKERIAHTHKLTEERGAADRSLDNARREYRDELNRHTRIHRAALSDHRDEIDRALAEARVAHADELEEQHREYETSLEAERSRRDAEIEAMTRRHQQELAEVAEQQREALERQAAQYKQTITALRQGRGTADDEIVELQRTVQQFRNEIAGLRKHQRQTDGQHASSVQKLQDDLAVTRTELASERERSKALREDVLKRSAESHELVDKALEERNKQLAELDAAVARQRDYADARVREIQALAEERSREAAAREADMTATISRLKHELSRLQGD